MNIRNFTKYCQSSWNIVMDVNNVLIKDRRFVYMDTWRFIWTPNKHCDNTMTIWSMVLISFSSTTQEQKGGSDSKVLQDYGDETYVICIWDYAWFIRQSRMPPYKPLCVYTVCSNWSLAYGVYGNFRCDHFRHF